MSTQNPQKPNILTSIQAEVGADQSTLLEWLTNHASKISGGIVLFIIAIGIYWGYSSYSDRQADKQRHEFSQLIASSTPESIVANLQNYVKTAPSSTMATALATLALEAQSQGNHEVAFTAWEQLGKTSPVLRVEASFGMSKAMIAQGNKQKALEVLEAALPGSEQLHLINLQSQIAAIAESMDNNERAATAYKALVDLSDTKKVSIDRERLEFWKSRLNALQAQG